MRCPGGHELSDWPILASPPEHLTQSQKVSGKQQQTPLNAKTTKGISAYLVSKLTTMATNGIKLNN